MAIMNAANDSSIYRLKKTWGRLPPQARDLWHELKKLTEKGARPLNKLMKETTPPLIPYMGVLIQNVLALQEYPDRIEGDLINFKKVRQGDPLGVEPLQRSHRFLVMFIQDPIHPHDHRKGAHVPEDPVPAADKQAHFGKRRFVVVRVCWSCSHGHLLSRIICAQPCHSSTLMPASTVLSRLSRVWKQRTTERPSDLHLSTTEKPNAWLFVVLSASTCLEFSKYIRLHVCCTLCHCLTLVLRVGSRTVHGVLCVAP